MYMCHYVAQDHTSNSVHYCYHNFLLYYIGSNDYRFKTLLGSGRGVLSNLEYNRLESIQIQKKINAGIANLISSKNAFLLYEKRMKNMAGSYYEVKTLSAGPVSYDKSDNCLRIISMVSLHGNTRHFTNSTTGYQNPNTTLVLVHGLALLYSVQHN